MIQPANINLAQTIGRWNLRRRLQQSVVWVPRGLIFGLIVAVGIAAAARMRPLFVREETLSWGGAAALAGGLAALVVVWFWPRRMLDSARYYDTHFDLKERVSTALELAAGQHYSVVGAEIIALQQQDALESARAVNVGAGLPLRLRWRDLAIVAALVIVFLVLAFLPNRQAEAVAQQQALQQAINQEAQNMHDLREAVTENPDLSEEERAEILETLDEAIQTLEQPDLSREEAMATLAETGEQLEEMSNRREGLEASPEMDAAGDALRQAPNEQAQQMGEAMQTPDGMRAAQAAREMAQQLESLSPEEREALAQQLEQAADALEAENPELAEQMREAAEALREGDLQRAQEALQNIADQMEQEAADLQRAQEAMQNMTEQMEQSQQALSQQQGRPPSDQAGQQQDGQQGDQQGDQGQEGSGEQPASQQGEQQSGENQGDGGSPQAGPVPDDMELGLGEGQQPAAGMMDSGLPAGEDEQRAGASQSENDDSGGAGAGEGEAGFDQEAASGAANGDEASAANAPGDAGVRYFEPVYVPSRIGGESDDMIQLPVSPEDLEDAPVVEGDLVPQGTGESFVPYSEVYGQYADAANSALESGRIPLGMRGIIREYFASLEP